MSKIEDFKNAPVGATATSADGIRIMKTDDGKWGWGSRMVPYLSDEEMANEGFTLEPPVPTSAREALDLAWNLAHPVKAGQTIPEGTEYLGATGSGMRIFGPVDDFKISPERAPHVRTLEPLTDPEPDWLDAPAVIAWSRWDVVRREKVWSKDDECYKSTDGEIIDWSDLHDVTPLYPKEGQEA